IDAATAGDVDDARQNLAEALSVDREYVPAWLWFASLARDDAERRFCLERAVQLDPDPKTRAALTRLRAVAPVIPPELAGIIDPAPPPDFTYAAAPRLHRRRGFWAALAALIVAVFVAGLALVLRGWTHAGGEPVYVAFAGGMSGPGAAYDTEMVDSIRLYFDRVNRDGGIDGHPVQLLVYDDKDDPATAQSVARKIVADGRAVLVIGHRTSSASDAAAPIYDAAEMPAITATANADNVTLGHPWYFRMTFNNTTQGTLLAAYLHDVLKVDRISIVADNSDYGSSLFAGVMAAYPAHGQVRHALVVDVVNGQFAASLAQAVSALRNDPDPGTIVLAVETGHAEQTIVALRDAGIAAPILGSEAIGSDLFLAALANLPAERERPGRYTGNLTAASPLIMDSLTSESLRWYDGFRDAYDATPGWRGATSYEAAIAAVDAIRSAVAAAPLDDRTALRAKARDALVALDSPQHSLPGLLGPIWFDHDRTPPRSVSFGVAHGDQYQSAPIQLRPYLPQSDAEVADEVAQGLTVKIGNDYFDRQRIVFAGINFNRIGELNTSDRSFFADFFLWLKYPGNNDAANIMFTNAVDPKLSLGAPLRSSVEDGMTYRLYRVTGRFNAPLEFHDFPFDQQHLIVQFQNRTLPSWQLVYAIDPALLDTPQAVRLASGSNVATSVNDIPNWEASSIDIYQDTVGTTALLGDPEALASSGGVNYSLFTANVTIARALSSFLIKNLLPLALLVLVTYVSLFFSAESLEARVSFGVTGILTTAVLLTSVRAALPDVGYTVAIEWGFYAFIVLAALCILVAMYVNRLYRERRLSDIRRMDLVARIGYPAIVAVVVLAYAIKYG
ncbi:MAG TPA: ABC transporter substrate-binding protein, partial [Thermomicrobiales bacterium]|nr:ABC transporter substrate-binding protein [Thermomicrobiales bacterium]